MTETTDILKTYIDLTAQVQAVNIATDPFTENDYWQWLDEQAPDDINSVTTKAAYLSERFGFVKGVHKIDQRTIYLLKHIEDYWFTRNRLPALRSRLAAEEQARQQARFEH